MQAGSNIDPTVLSSEDSKIIPLKYGILFPENSNAVKAFGANGDLLITGTYLNIQITIFPDLQSDW